MPTIQEIIAKREELAKTNPNATNVDARKALTPTPVAGVSPTPTTTPPVATTAQTPTAPVTSTTAPTAPQVTGVDGQKFAQAPVDITTGLSTPIAPAPVVAETPAPVKTEVASAKTAPVVDYTQAKGREQEITTNLEGFKAQGMTPEQILKASDYANASPEKKAMIEPYLKQTQPTTDSMFNSIVAKVDVPDAQKVLPSYKIAQNRYLKANMYASMTPSQVTQEMNASRLIEGSRTWEDLKTLNPKLAQDAQNLRIVNGSKSNIFTPVNNPDGTPVKDENGEQVKENNLIKTFTQDYLDDYGDFLREIYRPETMEEINAKIYTPDVKMAQDKATEIELELNAIEKDINSIEADIDKEMTGTGATGSRARLEKAIRAEKLQNLYDSTLKNYQTYANKANNLINQNTATYQEAYKQNQVLKDALASAGGQKYANELKLSQSQAEFEQKLAQQAQLASDPTTATNQIIDTFAEMGITADRSRQEIIADVQKKVASGIPLGQALSELQTAFKSKPEYQRAQQIQMGALSDIEQLQASQNFDLRKMGMEQNFQMALAQAKQTTDTKWTKLDDGLYTNDSGEIITADELKTAKLMGNSYITKQPGEEGGECGFYASRGTGMTSTPGGNSKEARVQAFSDSTPQVGGMAFFGGAGYDKTYGHIAIVTGVNEDGTINIKDSNYANDKRVQERTVPVSSVTGYYNSTPLAKSISGKGAQVTPEAQSWVNAWNNGTMDIETILTKIGTSKEAMGLKNQVIKAIDEQGGVAWRKENDPMVGKMDDLISKLDTASKSKYLNTISGTVQTSLTNFLTGGKSDLLSDLKTVIEGGTLQSLIDAKAQGATFGALSNEELKMLQATSSSIAANAIRDPDTKEIIGFRMSESKLKSELEKMKKLFEEKKSRMTGAGLKSNVSSQPNQTNIDTESEINAFDAWQANQ